MNLLGNRQAVINRLIISLFPQTDPSNYILDCPLLSDGNLLGIISNKLSVGRDKKQKLISHIVSARIQLFKQLKVKLILPNDFFVQRSGDKDQMFIENYVITRQIGANKLLLIALVIDR